MEIKRRDFSDGSQGSFQKMQPGASSAGDWYSDPFQLKQKWNALFVRGPVELFSGLLQVVLCLMKIVACSGGYLVPKVTLTSERVNKRAFVFGILLAIAGIADG